MPAADRRGRPARAGQPTQIQLLVTLGQLRGAPGGGAAEAAWAAAVAGPGYDCDAAIVPVVTGHLDAQLLGQLAAGLLDRLDAAGWHAPDASTSHDEPAGQDGPSAPDRQDGQACPQGQDGQDRRGGRDRRDERDDAGQAARRRQAGQALRQILLARAVGLPH